MGGGIVRTGIRICDSIGVIIPNNAADKCRTLSTFTNHTDNVLVEDNVASRAQTQCGIYFSNACVVSVVHGVPPVWEPSRCVLARLLPVKDNVPIVVGFTE
jgi:hypothetical protein